MIHSRNHWQESATLLCRISPLHNQFCQSLQLATREHAVGLEFLRYVSLLVKHSARQEGKELLDKGDEPVSYLLHVGGIGTV